jgi:uncharacterized membrane protein
MAKAKNPFALLEKLSYHQYLLMPDKDTTKTQEPSDSFLSRATVVLVRKFGSWFSVLIHSLIFAGWILLGFDLEKLLVIVSLEAIYIGIFILMAENVETTQREHQREIEHQKDMAVVKQDVVVDKKSLRELQEIHKKIDKLQRTIKEK